MKFKESQFRTAKKGAYSTNRGRTLLLDLSPMDKLGLHVEFNRSTLLFVHTEYLASAIARFLAGERLVETNLLNLTPQGEVRPMGAFPGLKTPGLNPAAASGRRALARSKP